jgi:hypothetical protein
VGARKARCRQTMWMRDYSTDQEWLSSYGLSAGLSWKNARHADRGTSSVSDEIVRMSWCLSCQQPVWSPWQF